MNTTKNEIHKEIRINVDIIREIYNNDDFYIYIGAYKHEEVSIKCSGFDLALGKKVIVGYFGKPYNGQKTFIASYEEFDSTCKESQFNLLCTIEGIKENIASSIMNEVDDINVFRNDDYPKIHGIGEGRIRLIREGLQKLDKMQDFKNLNMLLGQYASRDMINKINKVIESRNNKSEKLYKIEDFKKNPYDILINDLEYSFRKTDEIALKIGVKYDNYNRNKYLVEYLVFTECKSNCFVYYEKLKYKVYSFGASSKFTLTELIEKNDRLRIEDNKVYTKSIYEAEAETPKLLNFLQLKGDSIEKNKKYQDDIEKLIQDFENQNKIKFDEKQKIAIKTAANSSISIITGYAGSGKTTILKCVLYILERRFFVNVLTAPTGKASRRMNQATGIEASTIHSFIFKEVIDESLHIHMNESDILTGRKSVMVIDEFSMVDIVLFSKLLCAIINKGNFTKLILVGDPGQLPSVQPGNCLHDLIESNIYPVIKLTKTFRQEKESNIIPVSSQVRNNQMFDFVKKSDFFVRECENSNYYSQISTHMYEHLQSKYKDESGNINLDEFYNDVQFIAPIKKGQNGVNGLNELLKNKFNPKSKEFDLHSILIALDTFKIESGRKIIKNKKYKIKNINTGTIVLEDDSVMFDGIFTIKKETINKQFKKEDFPFDVNDKVMNIKNDKENDVYNGEFGRVVDITCKTFVVYFQDLNKEVTYTKTKENINKFQLSYCCTVHKLQGSEFKYICIVLENDNPLCDSRLLYTAITRGKQTVILLTDKTICSRIVERNNMTKRNTFFKERLIAYNK